MNNIPLEERIIFALDVATAEEALQWVKRLESHVHFYKVGLQLFLNACWPVIDSIVERGHKVMLDLKFFDIPETVQKAIAQLTNKKVTFTTVHGNEPIIEAAVAKKEGLKVLAVTVLTSFDESDLHAMGLKGTVQDLVLHRAQKAIELGCDGVVASPQEARALRKKLGDHFLIVTPGIRPGTEHDIKADDQRRIATPKEAIRGGADHLVIGRPIRTADDPIKVVEDIQREIQEGLAAKNKTASGE